MKVKHSSAVIFIIIAVAIAAIASIWYFQFKRPHDLAVADFNTAAAYVQSKNAELDAALNKLQSVVDSDESPLDEAALTGAQAAIAAVQESKVEIPTISKKTGDILADTQKLREPLDYSAKIEELENATKSLEDSIRQLKQITNPSEEFVIKRLQTIPAIAGIQAATEDHDPNGKLNKQNGYTAAVFFASALIEQDKVYGSGILEKGTDGGGCVEVYATREDAEKRNTYLSAFDGATMLSPGSHSVAGTVVIRTSDEHTATEQKELEKQILNALTALEE